MAVGAAGEAPPARSRRGGRDGKQQRDEAGEQQQQQQQQPPRHKKPPAVAAALSGALSGALISACVQPLDVLRTRMQADAALGARRTTAETLRTLLAEGGARGMWRGTGPTVVRLSLGAGINFVVLEKLKAFMLHSLPQHVPGQLGFLQAAMVGGLSRALSAAVMSPVTLVKTRMEYGGTHAIHYRNTWHALSTIASAEGPRGLFRGMGPTVLANAPFSALYYMFYTKMRHALAEEGRPQVAVNLFSGLVGATAATLLTQPSDVVRTRVQLGLGTGAAGAGAGLGGAWATLAGAVRSGGPGALLTGAAPRIAKRSLQTALVWTLYEELVPALSAAWLSVVDSAQSKAEAAPAGRGDEGQRQKQAQRQQR
ncbi:solute carrier family 25 member [Raphidocelis subcapitata]|uniref:Solute carrier family 25 member n=1 Tax=Raphidocelis subcapitata TaxID=307507 RepID=A0A2V0P8P7_9CHLO|nr:solute carrier family 25 member [Raphidocelis subcapitata]|eukprot:GBF94263.1 solute carrier family 25 member [Raphidocelis subcapitata]